MGSPLIEVGIGVGAEVVDVEVDGTWAVLCGGFGARISRLAAPDSPEFHGSAARRCQHAAFGPALGDGTQVLYLTHHGDTWVPVPFLQTLHLLPDGRIDTLATLEDTEQLFEGAAWRDGWLYAATHGHGLQVYVTDGFGVPTHHATVDTFEDVTRVATGDGVLYVADDARVHALSLADPGAPQVVTTVDVAARVRDLYAHGRRLYVAVGSEGFEVFDTTSPSAPAHIAHVPTEGSIQSVAANDDRIALAAWTHVQVRDPATLKLLGSRKSREYHEFEQDFGIALHGRHLYVGEWEGLHILEHRPDHVAPDLWVREDLFQFDGEEATSRWIDVLNRGPLPLEITAITSTRPATYAFEPTAFTVEPGEQGQFRLDYTPPAPDSSPDTFLISSNDPDAIDIPVQLQLYATGEGTIGIGDRLTEHFAFLDPAGDPQLSGLEGHVVVLAYFALF